MSAMGHKLPRDPTRSAAALPPKADTDANDRRGCFGPIADSCTAAKTDLFDHLVGAQQ
jgi:hypothetical protein